MKSKLDPKILELIHKVRKACVQQFDDIELAEKCAPVSMFLSEVLNENGFESIVIMGCYSPDSCMEADFTDHCWVNYNGIIIDLTAKQFDQTRPYVYIVKQPKRMYRLVKVITSVKDFDGWPSHQKPYSKMIQRLREKL